MTCTKRGGVRLAVAMVLLLPLTANAAVATPVGAAPAAQAPTAQAPTTAAQAPTAPDPDKPRPRFVRARDDRYIAVFRNRQVARERIRAVVEELRKRDHLLPGLLFFRALRGFGFRASERFARLVANDPRVEFVQPDYRVIGVGGTPRMVTTTQRNTPSWGIDRIDQRGLPLNHEYMYPTTASNVTAYIIDSGVLTTHQEFQGRASTVANFVNDGRTTDCNGHGTHVAGTVGGNTVGVAKGVRIASLRVLGCDNSGSTSGIVAAVDWVEEKGRHPGVVTRASATVAPTRRS